MANDEEWASDDSAGDLLSGVLHETEDEAKEEIEQVEEELQKRREEEERRRREEEERRRAEAEARITAEEERLDELEQRRTERLQAIEREKMREKGIEPEPEEQETDEQPSEQQSDGEPSPQEANREAAGPAGEAAGERVADATAETERPEALAADEPAGGSSTGWVLAAVALLAVGGGVGAYLYLNQGYQADSTTYAKTVYEPTEPQTQLVEASATMVATEDAEEEEPETTSAPTRRRPPSRPTSSGSSGSSSSGGSQGESTQEEDDDLDIDLEGTDPFGSDDM